MLRLCLDKVNYVIYMRLFAIMRGEIGVGLHGRFPQRNPRTGYSGNASRSACSRLSARPAAQAAANASAPRVARTTATLRS